MNKDKLIKPLEWQLYKERSRLTDTKGIWYSKGGLFTYEIHRNKNGKYVWSESPSGSNFRLPFTDLRSCKKAVEAHYKARVSKALV